MPVREVEMDAGRGGEKEVREQMVEEKQDTTEDGLEGRGGEDKKVIQMSVKERRRQGMMALFKADPRLARRA